MDVGLILIGFAGGVVSGMLGVGGGVLFVPALLLFTDVSQVEAEATSLLAIIPTALVGAWRQHRYGNLRVQTGIAVGALSVGGVAAGVVLANVLPERALQIAFAMVTLFTAYQLARRATAPRGDET